MGNPRFVSGVAYQVGSCKTQGFSPRPKGYSCSVRKMFPPPVLLGVFVFWFWFFLPAFTFTTGCGRCLLSKRGTKADLRQQTVRQQNPKLLRQPGPLLLHRQRCQRAPRVRAGVRSGRVDFHQEQAQQQLWRRRWRWWQHYYHHWLRQHAYDFARELRC